MTIKYRINKNDNKVKIFGKKIVFKNYNNCNIIVEDNEQQISEMIYINQNMKNKNILEIKLIEKKILLI